MAAFPQTLEIAPYGGGAGQPQSVPSPSSLLAEQVARGVSTQVLGAPRKWIFRAMENRMGHGCPPGCCSCGQQGRRPPYDQTPYSEPPGLGQPTRPQKPFQGLDKDPCEEALARAGIDPNCLRKMMRGTRMSPKRATAKRKKSTPARRRSKSVRIVGRRPMSRMEREAYFPEDFAAAPRRKRKVRAKAKRGRAKVPSRATRVARGKYQLLQNGACYDPVRRKFVKRALCR